MEATTCAARTAEFKDRTAGLILFGVVEILLGALCAVMVPLVGLAAALGNVTGVPMEWKSVVPSMSFYLLLSGVLIWLGIGSILTRRWARTLMLMLAWLWLACGVLGFVGAVVFLPGMLEELAGGGAPVDDTARDVVLGVTFGLLGLFHVAVPASFVLFYRSRHVIATCEHRDPVKRWTDKVPDSVLALSLSHAFLAYSLIWLAAYHWTMPFFGIVLTGGTGAAAAAIGMALCLWLTRGLYLRKPVAWWGATGLAVAGTLSWFVTVFRVGLNGVYDAMNVPPEQLDLLASAGMLEPWKTHVVAVVFVVAYLAYLLGVKKYFAGDERAAGSRARRLS